MRHETRSISSHILLSSSPAFCSIFPCPRLERRNGLVAFEMKADFRDARTVAGLVLAADLRVRELLGAGEAFVGPGGNQHKVCNENE